MKYLSPYLEQVQKRFGNLPKLKTAQLTLSCDFTQKQLVMNLMAIFQYVRFKTRLERPVFDTLITSGVIKKSEHLKYSPDEERERGQKSHSLNSHRRETRG